MSKKKVSKNEVSIPYVPLGNWIVMKLVDKNKKSLIITGNEKKAENKAKLVISVGPDVKFIKPGDIVELPNAALVSALPDFGETGALYATIKDTEVIGLHTD